MATTGAIEVDVLFRVERMYSFFRNSIFRYFTYFICLASIIVVGGCFLVLLTTYNLQFWQQYSPFVLGAIAVVCSYITFVKGENTFRYMHKTILPQLKSYRDLDQKHFKIIKFQAKLVEYWIVGCITSAMLIPIVSLPSYGDEYDILLPIKLLTDYFEDFAIFVIGCGARLLYITMHLKFQLYILMLELERMEKDCKFLRENNLVRNEVFQRKIGKDLIERIKHHQLIIKLYEELNELIRYPILGFGLTGTATFVLLLFAAFSGGVIPINPNGNIRIIIIVAFSLQLTGIFIFSGQTLLDESEQTFLSVTNLPWYHYNTQNRKLLMILMQTTQISLQLSSFNLIIINHPLVIKVIRNVYSYVTFFCTLQQGFE